jgi:hypothetical protein
MNRRDMCLDFRAKRINIDANVGDDIRFGMTLKLDKVDLPATDYDVATFIFDVDGNDISDDNNFSSDKADGLVKFVLEDFQTIAMGEGTYAYAIVITLTAEGDDYDRSYVNGALKLYDRSDVT